MRLHVVHWIEDATKKTHQRDIVQNNAELSSAQCERLGHLSTDNFTLSDHLARVELRL